MRWLTSDKSRFPRSHFAVNPPRTLLQSNSRRIQLPQSRIPSATLHGVSSRSIISPNRAHSGHLLGIFLVGCGGDSGPDHFGCYHSADYLFKGKNRSIAKHSPIRRWLETVNVGCTVNSPLKAPSKCLDRTPRLQSALHHCLSSLTHWSRASDTPTSCSASRASFQAEAFRQRRRAKVDTDSFWLGISVRAPIGIEAFRRKLDSRELIISQ